MSFDLVDLNHIAAAFAFFDEQIEREAQSLNKRRLLSEQINGDGVAESMIKGIGPELLARARGHVAGIKTSEPPIEKKQVKHLLIDFLDRITQL